MTIIREVELQAAESVCSALASLVTPQDDLSITVSAIKLGEANQTAYQFVTMERDTKGKIVLETFRMAWVTVHPQTKEIQMWLANYQECTIEVPPAFGLVAYPKMGPNGAKEYRTPMDKAKRAANGLYTFFTTGKRLMRVAAEQHPYQEGVHKA